MAVSVKTGDHFRGGHSQAPLQYRLGRGNRLGWASEYDVTADAERFLVNMAVAEARSLPITVVVNWTAELKPK